jgi:hypothetical protein
LALLNIVDPLALIPASINVGVDSESISLIGLELSCVDVALGMPECAIAFSLVVDPLTFVNGAINPFLDAITAPHLAASRGRTSILVNEHLALVHRPVRKHIIIYEY